MAMKQWDGECWIDEATNVTFDLATVEVKALAWASKHGFVDSTLPTAEDIIRKAMEEAVSWTYGIKWAGGILNSVLAYTLSGKPNRDLDFNTAAYVGDEWKPSDSPVLQMGMLGIPYAPLTKKQLNPDAVWVKCCTEDHEHLEGEDADCNCVEAECGCAVNPDNNGTCSRCYQCDVCCSADGNCFCCEGCYETRSTEHQCSLCAKCHDCCDGCWTCGSCDGQQSSDTSSCDYCGYCESCCQCKYCKSCEHNHANGTKWCEECESCQTSCSEHCYVCGEELCEDAFCSKCRRCPNCECSCPLPPPPPYTPKTQKARGLTALQRYNSSHLNVPMVHILAAAGAQPERLVHRFVRPCPTVPRHGFVDSRKIHTIAEAEQIIVQALAADPEAEFLLMDEIQANYSAVWTPGMIAIGPGNDGATAGKASRSLPVAGDYFGKRFYYRSDLMSESNITESPYVELLWTSDRTHHTVQLRNGPKLPQQVDYIAAEVEIKKIIVAEGDLLEWETTMKSQEPGTVVYHPGGSLASHYAVHAVLNNIPVLISREPKIGEVIQPNLEGEAKDFDLEQIKHGFYWALHYESQSYRAATYFMLLGLHSTVLWKGRHDYLIGAALGFCYRLAILAGLGEWRHKANIAPKKHNNSIPGRETVYERVWERKDNNRGAFMRSLRDFRVKTWGGSIGGEKWFQFTKWAAYILNSILEGDISAAIAAMNNCVNSSHNNGWGFNKFASGDAMTYVANDPVHAICHCGPMVYKALTQPTATEVVAAWFGKCKRLPIEDADKWLASVPFELEQTGFAQVCLVGNVLHIQYKHAQFHHLTKTEEQVLSPIKAATVEMALEQKQKAGFEAGESFVAGDTKEYWGANSGTNKQGKRFFYLTYTYNAATAWGYTACVGQILLNKHTPSPPTTFNDNSCGVENCESCCTSTKYMKWKTTCGIVNCIDPICAIPAGMPKAYLSGVNF